MNKEDKKMVAGQILVGSAIGFVLFMINWFILNQPYAWISLIVFPSGYIPLSLIIYYWRKKKHKK